MKLTKNWRDEILEAWGIETLRSIDRNHLDDNKVLWITRCSKTKKRKKGEPKDLYVSQVNCRFYNWVSERRLRYGVLSDRYGLHLDMEVLPYYDIHPSSLDEKDKIRLGWLIAEKTSNNNWESIIFYNPSPLMSIPYFQILFFSGLKVMYITKLPDQISCDDM